MAGFRQLDWYETPLYYEIVFAADTAREAGFLEAVAEKHGAARRRGGAGPRALEPACGTGRLLIELARRGYRGAGFDASPAMVEFAQLRTVQTKTADAVKVGVGRMEDFRLRGRFDLAFCLLSTFKFLTSDADARAHLALVRDHLKPGGLYVLGIHLTDYSRTRPEHERWVAVRDGVHVVCNTRTFPPDRRRRLERVRTRLSVSRHGHTERLESNWLVRTYSPRQFVGLLGSTPGLSHAATYDFNHDIGWGRHPVGSRAPDAVAVLVRE